MRAFTSASLLALALLACIHTSQTAGQYYGKLIGPLKSYYHGVTGDVYAVDSRTLHIRDFNYDGEGPAAYFIVGSSKAINNNGHRLLDERGQPHPIKKYTKKHITLTLPEGKTLSNIKWFSVFCEEFTVSFADIKIPKGLDYPKPQKIARLNGVHAVSSDPVVVVDAQTLLIPSFSFDGEAPDAKFWVGRGPSPSPQGIRVPDENGKEVPLRRYDRKTIVLTLPGDLTVFEIGHFGVWCEAFTVDFGHIQVPAQLNVPPSLKMLGVSPQSKLNCEVLHEEMAFEVRWAVAGDSIVVQLVAKLEDGEYMSFGPSGHPRQNQMVGGDVVVAWVDHDTLNGYAVDYFLDDKSQCSGGRGSCPDYRIQPENTSSVRLLNAALVNGYSIVTYQRPLVAHDELDQPILTNNSQAVIWAVGPLNQKKEVSFHSVWSKENILLDFGRSPQWNCPIPESDAALNTSAEQHGEADAHGSSSVPKENAVSERVREVPTPAPATRPSDAWEIPPIQCNEPDDGVFYAQMGPTGGKRGYPAITGHVGWGISYYINGLLIPEINVVRGKTYTFVVEGGLDTTVPAKYHPFYITDDPVGGYANKSPEEQKKIKIFAGVEQTRGGNLVPTGVGRLCNWTPDPEQPPADDFVSFGAYQRTLTLICDHGEPGVIQWTPDEDTPDTVYYQCFIHRYLGWKINVLDECDLPTVAGSEHVESRVKYEREEDELEPHSSIQVSTRVKPEGPNYLPLVSNIGLKTQDLMAEYKKNYAQIPVSYKEPETLSAHYYESSHGPAANHKYPASTMDVYTEPAVQSTTDNGRDIIPVSEDITQDTSTEKSKPMLSDKKESLSQNSTEAKNKPIGTPYNRPQIQQGPMTMGGRPLHRRPVLSTMTIIRPHHRRPVPHHHMMVVPKPVMHRPMTIVPSSSQYRPVFVKKPIYRMPAVAMHRPVIMVPQPHQQESVMHHQRTSPNVPGPQVTKTVSVSYSSSKGKSKPEPQNPIKSESVETKKYILPQSKPYKHDVQHVNYKTVTPVSYSHPSSNEGYSNPIGSSGFNPGTLVIEGGFKPIIQNTQEAQDRISEVDDIDDTEGTIDLTADEAIQKDGSIDKTKATEYFEPLFIPSPPDSVQKYAKKPTGLENDVLQKKKSHISRKPIRQNMIVIRRRPVSPSFRSQHDDAVDETAMAAERMYTYYLPPSGPIYGISADGQVPVPANLDSGTATLLTYDGKAVSANNVVPPPPSPSVRGGNTKRKLTSAELVRSTPQFGSFHGELPPPVPKNIRPESIPQLKLKSESRPAHAASLQLNPQSNSSPIRTQLSLVRQFEETEESDGLLPEASELDEYKYEVQNGENVNDGTEKVVIVLTGITPEDSNATSEFKKDIENPETELNEGNEKTHVYKRDKRNAHNIQGHEDKHSEHSHSDHEHHLITNKKNETMMKNSAFALTSNPTFVVVSLLSIFYHLLFR